MPSQFSTYTMSMMELSPSFMSLIPLTPVGVASVPLETSVALLEIADLTSSALIEVVFVSTNDLALSSASTVLLAGSGVFVLSLAAISIFLRISASSFSSAAVSVSISARRFSSAVSTSFASSLLRRAISCNLFSFIMILSFLWFSVCSVFRSERFFFPQVWPLPAFSPFPEPPPPG